LYSAFLPAFFFTILYDQRITFNSNFYNYNIL
jgi:hypothetical protein